MRHRVPTRAPHGGRPLLLATVLAALAACGDGGTEPRGGPAGFFRLQTVDGRPLPIYDAPSFGLGGSVLREGQLALRGDGTFGYGIAAPLGGFADGSWTRSGSTVTLGIRGGSPLTARWNGDTIVVAVPGAPSVFDPTPRSSEFVFLRAAAPVPPVPDGTYVLRTVDGQPPSADGFLVYDAPSILSSGREVQVIRWDTLVVRAPFVVRSEGVAFADGLPLTAPGVLSGGTELSGWGGAVAGDATRLIIRPFGGERWASGRPVDTLAVAGSGAAAALVRTYAFPGQPTRTLRYERVR